MFRLEDFFSIADNRWEINHFERTIDFGKDTELSALYFALKENEKLVVNEVLDKLTGDSDNWGYNLKMVLEKFRMPFLNSENEVDHVRFDTITSALFKDKQLYWDKKILKIWNDFLKDYSIKENISTEYLDDIFESVAYPLIRAKLTDAYRFSYFKKKSKITENEIAEIKKQIAKIKKLPVDSTKDSPWFSVAKELLRAFLNTIPLYDFISIICEYCCIDMDLIRYGIGKVYELNEFYSKDFFDTIEDPEDSFHAHYNALSAFTFLKVIKAYENYLMIDEALKDGQHVVIERWGVINYSGKYLMLKKKADDGSDTAKKELDAVRTLIIDLFKIGAK